MREKVELATKFGISFADGKWEIRGDPAFVGTGSSKVERTDLSLRSLHLSHPLRIERPAASARLFPPQAGRRPNNFWPNNAQARRKQPPAAARVSEEAQLAAASGAAPCRRPWPQRAGEDAGAVMAAHTQHQAVVATAGPRETCAELEREPST